VVPTGAAFVDGAGPAGYATVEAGPKGRQLAVTQAPDHALYFSDPQHI
jgi:hypothetical protein